MDDQRNWGIEAGPITSNQLGEYADVSYSIRVPGGTIKIGQRIHVPDGYALALERVERICKSGASPTAHGMIRELQRREQ